ncbi:glycine/betaine ABC transporter ATP-binding protein [Anaerosporomusa subterranea]|uniref:Quaternary amine transport ATP-binding protein n=1 Tax=Anaerosporomusa subterranea TaxID=1794912 RepID=A0A154BM15_ANASB|nr:ABC transporter ATP-binding protein [Anaerosporomusa subterranea]KYZ75014.1 glycine/betaine ABC transporter ATP-binding protein [Anaerosporomusa subterranea]
MIKFEQVSKRYDKITVLNEINLQVQAGEIFVLIGPSGCGKTTTMKMINRLIEPSSGKITINGTDISELDPVELRRNIGYVIQSIGLLPHMTIAENVALVPRLKKWDEDAYIDRVNDLLKMVKLDPQIYGNRYPAELSGGQQQRVGVIRAMAADPPIILMDEPFSALDPISREQLQEELVRLQEVMKKTIVFVTHDMDEALKIGNRICLLHNGKVVQLDTPEQILRHPANEFVRGFIGESRLRNNATLPAISDVMVRPITSRPNKGLAEAIMQMRKQKVDTLLIVDSDNKLLGRTSVWDIQSRFDDENLALRDVLDPFAPCIAVNCELTDAIQMISQEQVSYLAVVNSDHKLLGVLTRASLVDVMAEQFSNGTNNKDAMTASEQKGVVA